MQIQLLAQGILKKLQDAGGAAYNVSGNPDTQLPTTVGGIIKVLLTILGVIFLVLIVYAGYIWMIARGNEEEATRAKDIIKNAVIGLLITLAAYAITGFIVSGLTRATGVVS